MAARTSYSSHSAASVRRRRLLLLGIGKPVEPHDELDAEAGGTALPDVVHSMTSEVDSRSIDRSFSPPVESRPPTIQGLVASQIAVSWLFVGDSFTPKNVTEPRPWRVFTNRFAGAIRSHFQRDKDVFIDATFPSARLSEVLFDFERRIAKFEPDICFLSLCLAEADSKATERFERMLVRLIRWSKKFDCQLVLQTPPCLPSKNDAELTRRLILIESIRGIAAEHSITLIDHWEHWEGAMIQTPQTVGWLDLETQTPDEQGHLQLAKRMVQDLNLKEAARSSVSQSVSKSIASQEV